MTAVLPTDNVPSALLEPSAEPESAAPDELRRLLRVENAELRALLALQGDLGQASTPKEVLQDVVGQVHAALGSQRCSALL